MNLSLRIVQKQEPMLYVTPQLKQALKILQLPADELKTYVQEMFLENPFIDIDVKADADWKNDYRTGEGDLMKKYDYMMHHLPKTRQSLIDDLLSQLGMLSLPLEMKKVITDMIYHLDDRGYFSCETEEFCLRHQISKETFNEALRVVQSFEPIGIGARDLRECLLIQLRHLNNAPALTIEMIENYYDLLINAQWEQLAKELSVTVKEIREAAAVLRTLSFRPAERFMTEEPIYIVPELIIEKAGEELIVMLNEDALPFIKFNEQYVAMCLDMPPFIKGKLKEAKWLIQCIRQRNQTLLSVANAVISVQKAFFLSEPGELKPLTLRDVAEMARLNPSTVCRAVQGKFLETPKGVIPFKKLFSTKIQTLDGTKASAHMAKEKIRALIQSENKNSPYSDAEIARLLKKQNICLSRRTVAKYREEMGIGSSKLRKINNR